MAVHAAASARLVDQLDENVLEARLVGRQVLVGDAEVAQAPHQRGDAGPLGMAVEFVAEHVAVIARAATFHSESSGGIAVSGSASMMSSVLLAHLGHQRLLLVDRDQLAAADDADAVGHLLGFLDVMGGEDDRRAVGAKLAHQVPHVAAKLDVDAGGRLVEEQDVGLVAQRLGDHHPALHPAGEVHHDRLALVPQRQALEQVLDHRRRRAACRTGRARS